MKKYIISICITGLISIHLFGQSDTVFNKVDKKGQKQGYWQKHYPNGKLMYKGKFINNIPVGKMERYYESGGIQAVLDFDENEQAKAVLFYENGIKSAEGFYYKMQKDSLWKYYSYYTKTLLSEERYIKGKKHGIHRSYYENGQISEEIEWQNDTKEGKWMQYFPNGKEKMKTRHSFNMVNGRYYFYYENGLLMMLGSFEDDKRHGPWVFYDKNGKEKYKIDYNFGTALNADELIKNDEEYFKVVEENIGKFEDPSVEDFFPGNKGY